MSFYINLYTHTKKVDSTKQPTGTGTQYSCNILTPADITAPVVEISASADLTAYNYAYISAFHRYYWIEGISFEAGIWVLTLAVDVLATYKTQIGSESLYVLRAASASDGNIMDNLYPTKASVNYTQEIASPFYNATPYDNGFYVVNISGVATAGTSTLWKLTPTAFRTFISSLYANIDGFQFADIFDAAKKLVQGSPTKLVSSAMWFPGQVTFTTQAAEELYVGGWDSGVQAQLITNPVYTDSSIWFTVHKHPQAATRGAFLNLSPYSIYTLCVPLFGSVNLDSTALIGATGIQLYLRVDAISGTATLQVDSGGSRPQLAFLTAQLGVAMPLDGQTAGASVAGGLVSTLAGVATAIASGGAAAAVIGAAQAGIGTAVSAMSGASFSSGSAGSILAPTASWELDSTHFTIADEDNTHNGRPLMQVKQLSALSGFIMVQKGDVPIPGTSSEAQKVKDFLEGGFFYE